MEKDLVYTEINGTQGVYDVQRIAISDYIYAAKEVCGPIAYNGKGKFEDSALQTSLLKASHPRANVDLKCGSKDKARSSRNPR